MRWLKKYFPKFLISCNFLFVESRPFDARRSPMCELSQSASQLRVKKSNARVCTEWGLKLCSL